MSGRDGQAEPLGRMDELGRELAALRAKLEFGGGPERIRRQHAKGKLAVRERLARLLDPGAVWTEIGLLVAHDRYDGKAPAAGVVTGVGSVAGREVVVVANDATVKAGSWWPETIGKILRAQEIAMRCRVPILYLVDSAGVNLPYQGGVFPGQYGAARIFYYCSMMRRYLKVPHDGAIPIATNRRRSGTVPPAVEGAPTRVQAHGVGRKVTTTYEPGIRGCSGESHPRPGFLQETRRS